MSGEGIPNFEIKKVIENSSNDVLQADFSDVFASDEINYFILHKLLHSSDCGQKSKISLFNIKHKQVR